MVISDFLVAAYGRGVFCALSVFFVVFRVAGFLAAAFGAMTDFLLATRFFFDDIVVALYWLILSQFVKGLLYICLLYTSPSPRD